MLLKLLRSRNINLAVSEVDVNVQCDAVITVSRRSWRRSRSASSEEAAGVRSAGGGRRWTTSGGGRGGGGGGAPPSSWSRWVERCCRLLPTTS